MVAAITRVLLVTLCRSIETLRQSSNGHTVPICINFVSMAELVVVQSQVAQGARTMLRSHVQSTSARIVLFEAMKMID